jgi:hypothetical protein
MSATWLWLALSSAVRGASFGVAAAERGMPGDAVTAACRGMTGPRLRFLAGDLGHGYGAGQAGQGDRGYRA